MKVELLYAESSIAASQTARVERMKELVERSVVELCTGGIAKVGGAARQSSGEESLDARDRIELVSGPCEPPESFDEDDVPAGHGAHQRVEQIRRSPSPPEFDGVCHVDARGSRIARRNQACAHEVGDVRHRPVVARLHVLVFPQAVDRATALCRIFADQLDDAAKHARVRSEPILVAIDLRHELPKLFGVVAREAVADGLRRSCAPCSWHAADGPHARDRHAARRREVEVLARLDACAAGIGDRRSAAAVVNVSPVTAMTPSTCDTASKSTLGQNVPPMRACSRLSTPVPGAREKRLHRRRDRLLHVARIDLDADRHGRRDRLRLESLRLARSGRPASEAPRQSP